MKPILSFDALHASFAEAEAQRLVSDDALRASLGSWYLSPKLFGPAPSDPFSADYQAYQLDIYRQLTNQEYGVANEETEFDFEHERQWPYPYGTQSGQTVGNHLMDYGWLIKKMNLHPQARILEIGSGFGSLTAHLASMGYQVTCLDISARLLEFVRARTAGLAGAVHTVCGDMATVPLEGRFDAVIFNASFHHSLEHRHVLERLGEHLEPDGILAFSAEPILRQGTHYLPYSWGIRLDGKSVWSITKWGWLELGFQEGYFCQLLRQAGYVATHYFPALSEMAGLWIATRADSSVQRPLLKHPRHGYAIDIESFTNALTRKILQLWPG